jgi:signal transduction histidine kinase
VFKCFRSDAASCVVAVASLASFLYNDKPRPGNVSDSSPQRCEAAAQCIVGAVHEPPLKNGTVFYRDRLCGILERSSVDDHGRLSRSVNRCNNNGDREYMSELQPSLPGRGKKYLHRSSSLKRRFLLGIGVVFLAISLAVALVLYNVEKGLMEKSADEKTEMVLAAEEATRSYIQDVLRPKMYQVVGRDAFVLEAMSTSYISREVMNRLKDSLPEYQIRRVALHARNPASTPKPFEVGLIGYFASHPQMSSWHGIINIDGRSSFVHARPVRFTAECMHCHGNPADAPPTLIELYGSTRGFGYKSGEIAGVTAVSIPVDVALAEIEKRAASIFEISLAGLSLLYIGVFLFFNRVVIHSLRDLLEIFRRGLWDESERMPAAEVRAGDEISQLAATAQFMVGHLRDARQRLKDYAENLENLVQRIQHAERLACMGQLAGGLAHEINNPLGIILCYADLLKSQLADYPQGLKDLAIIEKHAVGCQHIVGDLLEFARGRETAREPTDLNASIEEMVRMVAPQFRRRHCNIELDLATDLPLVSIDVTKMKQVYLNLLMNARQAIKGRGVIRVETRRLRDAGRVRIVFEDNGCGIPPEIIDRIFDPFFSTKETGEGTGLGLSVSYGIIKDHGGDIVVESEPGQWTRFTIELPEEQAGVRSNASGENFNCR